MSNLYCDLATFKARLNITGTGDDAVLLALLEHTSRAIDQSCNRFFYVKTETRYYDGAASPLLLDQDFAAVTGLKTDDNGRGTGRRPGRPPTTSCCPTTATPSTPSP